LGWAAGAALIRALGCAAAAAANVQSTFRAESQASPRSRSNHQVRSLKYQKTTLGWALGVHGRASCSWRTAATVGHAALAPHGQVRALTSAVQGAHSNWTWQLLKCQVKLATCTNASQLSTGTASAAQGGLRYAYCTSADVLTTAAPACIDQARPVRLAHRTLGVRRTAGSHRPWAVRFWKGAPWCLQVQ